MSTPHALQPTFARRPELLDEVPDPRRVHGRRYRIGSLLATVPPGLFFPHAVQATESERRRS
ncbi:MULTISPECIES: hypothetical protein [Streptomyces]|uniref:hypothetical protein n=1 Tax=Streptomyces TaxID=1883 RepID=UPI001160E8A2|nr:hypothetical protein [Streptomyces sp. TSRI0281]